jgi:hypothetical protein
VDRQAIDVKRALLGRQPKVFSYVINILVCLCYLFQVSKDHMRGAKKKKIFSKNEHLSAAHEGLRAAHWS